MTDHRIGCPRSDPHRPHRVPRADGFVDYDGALVDYDCPGVHADDQPHTAMAPQEAGRCGAFPPFPRHGQVPWSAEHACVLAAGHAGWHRDENVGEWSREQVAELTAAGLTAEQNIRARALTTAAAVIAEVGMDGDLDADCDLILDIAERFAAYITTGARTADHEDQLVGPVIGYEIGGRMYRPDDVTVVHDPATVEAAE